MWYCSTWIVVYCCISLLARAMFRGRAWWLFRVIHEYRWLIREACEERGGKIEKERLSQGALVEELELKQDMHLVWKSYCQSERIATWCSTTCQTQTTQRPIWSESVSENIPESSGLELSHVFCTLGRRCLGIWCIIVGWLGLVQKKGGFSSCGPMASSHFSSKPSCARHGARPGTDISKAQCDIHHFITL